MKIHRESGRVQYLAHETGLLVAVPMRLGVFLTGVECAREESKGRCSRTVTAAPEREQEKSCGNQTDIGDLMFEHGDKCILKILQPNISFT